MRKEIIETGKSVDSAIESACEKLGCLREDCEWEIIDLPKKVLLGLKSVPAKVKVSMEVPDEKPVEVKEPVQREPAPQKSSVAPQSAPVPRREIAKPRETQVRPEQKPAQDKVMRQPANPVDISPEREAVITNYLADILKAMELEASLEVVKEPDGICINITGQGLGVIIGRRGETLDSIQYLVSLVANRLEGDYLRVTIDCGDYRIKRQKTLEALARKLASQVQKTNKSKTLEPMNPFERRIIHATISEIEGVFSTSEGNEPNRKVVISTPTSKSRGGGYSRGRRNDQVRGGDRDRGGRSDYNRGGRDNRDRDRSHSPRPAYSQNKEVTVAQEPKKTPESTTDIPFFTKVELD